MYTTIAEGRRRTFTITVGLSEGYGSKSIVHHPDTVERVASEWMEARAKEGLLTISGFFMEGELHYTLREAEGIRAKHEPGVRFWGEVSIIRLSEIPDEKIIEVLNDLADVLGAALGQEHVVVSYRDHTWTRGLQAE